MNKTNNFLRPKITRDPVLRFSSFAWQKLIFMRDMGPTEVGGYGITATEDPLLITDFLLVKQECTSVTVELDTQDSIDFVERMTDAGIMPWQASSIWIHTHPSSSPNPSDVDEKNFDTNFSHPHWAVFFILAKEGQTYCRMRHNVGAGIEVLLDDRIDWSVSCPASNFKGWTEEYNDKVSEATDFSFGFNNDFNFPLNNPRITNQKDIGPPIWNEDEDDEIFENPSGGIGFWDDKAEEYYTYEPKTKKFYDELEDGTVVQIDHTDSAKWIRKIEQWSKQNV